MADYETSRVVSDLTECRKENTGWEVIRGGWKGSLEKGHWRCHLGKGPHLPLSCFSCRPCLGSADAWPWEGQRVPLCWLRSDSCHPVPLRSWFEGHGLAGKLRAIQTVSCLLQGPCDAGNRALELSGVMESVIALCASEREEEQLVAVEALIHAAGKAKRASFITANGVSLLKDLYKRSEEDSIRIRALVVSWTCGPAGVCPAQARREHGYPGQRPRPVRAKSERGAPCRAHS